MVVLVRAVLCQGILLELVLLIRVSTAVAIMPRHLTRLAAAVARVLSGCRVVR